MDKPTEKLLRDAMSRATDLSKEDVDKIIRDIKREQAAKEGARS